VVGLGEIGMPIYKLLRNRNFKVHGYDVDPKKKTVMLEDRYDMIHICIPYLNEKKFLTDVAPYRIMTDNLVIHSTVSPGTSKLLNAIYSPIRGVHHDMENCLKSFPKYYSSKQDNVEFQRRFPKCVRVDDSTKLERTKLVATERYGVDMMIARYFEEKHPHYREFFFDLNERYGILPAYYNDGKEIGGHCIVPNTTLLGDKIMADIINGKLTFERNVSDG
jgi:hypothetical protein